MRDSENTVNFHPLDYLGHKGFSAMKVAQLRHGLQLEFNQKFISQGRAALKASLELETIPECFNLCVSDVSTSALNAVEKNCMKDCYFRKTSSMQDVALLIKELDTVEYGKSTRERLV